MEQGADAVYCAGSLLTVRALADHGIAVCGHVRLIPSKRTSMGGFKAVGEMVKSAKLVWQQCKALSDAGAFAVEIEVVPQLITDLIAAKTGPTALARRWRLWAMDRTAVHWNAVRCGPNQGPMT